MLKAKFAKWLFHTHGWKLVGKPIPEEAQRCVFVFAPHTSNWDFYFGVAAMMGWGIPIKIAIKKVWTKFPLGLIVNPFGGIGIDRSKSKVRDTKGQVQNLANVFKDHQKIAFVITPEGSRSKRTQWKTGFYHIARLAKVPIVTLSGDYRKKAVEFGPVFTGNEKLEDIMREMMEFYKPGGGKFPDQFALDERYI